MCELTGAGSMHETMPANATAAREAGEARTSAFAAGATTGFLPGLSPCLKKQSSPRVQAPSAKNLHGTLLVSRRCDVERARLPLPPSLGERPRATGVADLSRVLAF